jgi:CubicO group peptidase (beta-lactamase class C family)
MKPNQFEAARAILQAGVEQHAFPGAALAVGQKGAAAIVFAGRQTYDAKSAAVAPDTVFDLASLTKVVATTTAAMILYERGQLHLDRSVALYLQDFVEPYDTASDPLWAVRGEITVRHLLAHTSGLPAYERFFLRAREKSHVLAEALALPLEDSPGRKTVYSDVGFILLGAILEQVSGQPLDAFCSTEIFAPLDMGDTCFNPPERIWNRVAPTEQDTEFRKRLIRGEVHDENAWVMGGVAGHAGLFGSVSDLARFGALMLAGGKAGAKRLLRAETLDEFTRAWPVLSGAARGLGWDKPGDTPSCGRYFSPASYGHLGFTGTSIWIDPAKDLFAILLTNRVHPTRANDSIRTIRPAVHNAIVEALDCGSAPGKAAGAGVEE